MPGWNENLAHTQYVVADDALGGLFALNGGSLGPDRGKVYYFTPDSLEWIALRVGYSEFMCWAISSVLKEFYGWMRWDGWEAECRELTGDRVISVYPFLWTQGPPVAERSRRAVPLEQWYDLQSHLLNQLADADKG